MDNCVKLISKSFPSLATKRSKKVEQCIEILSDIYGSKEEVLITLLEILESDGDFTHEQREEI